MKKENLPRYLYVAWPESQKLMNIEGFDDYCFPVFSDDVACDVFCEESWYDQHREELEDSCIEYGDEFVNAFGTKVQCALMCDGDVYDEAKSMYISDRIAGITSCPEEFITKYGDFRTMKKSE